MCVCLLRDVFYDLRLRVWKIKLSTEIDRHDVEISRAVAAGL